jgi:hypothetical protein
MERDMPAQTTIGGRGSDPQRSAPPPGPCGVAERAVLAQLEYRVPAVIVAQRRRQMALNGEARANAATSAERL